MMSTPPFLNVPPATVGLEQLDLREDGLAGEWSGVRDLVQAELSALDGPIRAAVGNIQVRAGSNRGGAARLFVYRVYDAEPGLDPVVIGVTVESSPDGPADQFRVHGDISGETLGDVHFESSVQDIMGWEAMTAAARTMGVRLSREADLVLAVLRDASRKD